MLPLELRAYFRAAAMNATGAKMAATHKVWLTRPRERELMGWLTGIVRLVSAVLVAFIFLVVLMTASAQQQVVSRLSDKDAPEHLDYSAALSRVKEAERDERQRAGLQMRSEKLITALAGEQLNLDQLTNEFNSAVSEAQPLINRAARVTGCDVPRTATSSAQWRAVIDCRREGQISDTRLGQSIDAATASKDGLLAISYRLDQATKTHAYEQAMSDGLKLQLAELDAKAKDRIWLKNAFGDLNVLRESWLLAGGLFVEFPPLLMQVVLAFFSGSFGALLITFVLLVYPHNDFGFTKSRDYAARIFLGGLVAVCIYVMLGGGAAVLGNSSSIGEGGSNVMTFCAVGVLSGMFSDRAAAWLSDRARTFFAQNAAESAKKPPGKCQQTPQVPNPPLTASGGVATE